MMILSRLIAALFAIAPPRGLDHSDVDFLHFHHRIEGAFCFSAASRHCFRQDPWRDLPGETPLVLAPAARALLTAIVDDGVPVAIGFFLIVCGDLEGEGFALFERGAAVETDAGHARDGEFNREHITLFARGKIAWGTVHGTHSAVWEYLGVEASRSLGVLVVSKANGVLVHCMSFLQLR